MLWKIRGARLGFPPLSRARCNRWKIQASASNFPRDFPRGGSGAIGGYWRWFLRPVESPPYVPSTDPISTHAHRMTRKPSVARASRRPRSGQDHPARQARAAAICTSRQRGRRAPATHRQTGLHLTQRGSHPNCSTQITTCQAPRRNAKRASPTRQAPPETAVAPRIRQERAQGRARCRSLRPRRSRRSAQPNAPRP